MSMPLGAWICNALRMPSRSPLSAAWRAWRASTSSTLAAPGGQQRRPSASSAASSRCSAGKSCRPARCAASPRRAVPAPPPPSAAVARRPPVRGRPAAPARPAPIGTTVAWPRPAAGHAGWRAGFRSCAVPADRRPALRCRPPRPSADPCAISSSAAFSAPSRRSVSASSWRNCCSRSRRSACACAAVKASRAASAAARCASRCCSARQRAGLAQALGAACACCSSVRSSVHPAGRARPDPATGPGCWRPAPARGASLPASRSRARATRRVRASTARASSAFQGSACCACPCSWRRAASRSTSASNCALARKRHRAPTARASASSASLNTPLGLPLRVQQRAALGGHALEQPVAIAGRQFAGQARQRFADGPGRGPPALSDWPSPCWIHSSRGCPPARACSVHVRASRSPTAPPAHSPASPSRRSAPPSISSSQRAFVRNCFSARSHARV